MLAGKGLYIVTGANTGVGKVVAMELAARGANLVLGCRSSEKAEAARLHIAYKTGNTSIRCHTLDLLSMESVKAFAETLKDERVACLVNNAGAMNAQHTLTADGFEATYQTNTLGPWLLTELLLPALRRSEQPRVVNVGSRLERTGDLSDLEKEQDALMMFRGGGVPSDASNNSSSFNTFKAYGTSKLVLSALSFEQARRYKDVIVSLVTPGIVNTEIGRFAHPALLAITWPLRRLLLRTPQVGGEGVAWLAWSQEPAAMISGGYFYDKQQIEASKKARDPELAARLWETVQKQTAKWTVK